ncbi:DUF2281 domain-containing protein [Pseudanabaena mucicola]|uniref:DUF2281 domain-containing protein n=1 Tax=Pseudanabaena mucicola TaxID=71190 RepID=UPI002577EF88|nr:DUF2281 domain-containing protein [Pseudanabaena mucicola]
MTIHIKERLLERIEKASETTLQEVLDFLMFIESKRIQTEQLEISLLSESVLAEDWLTPEEDEAWQHL